MSVPQAEFLQQCSDSQGKSKKDTQFFNPTTPLLRATCDDGAVFTFYWSVPSQLPAVSFFFFFFKVFLF